MISIFLTIQRTPSVPCLFYIKVKESTLIKGEHYPHKKHPLQYFILIKLRIESDLQLHTSGVPAVATFNGSVMFPSKSPARGFGDSSFLLHCKVSKHN